MVEVVQGKGFQAEIIRTRRKKTVAIKVEEGRVSVVVPKFATTPPSGRTRHQKDPLDTEKVAPTTVLPSPEPEGICVR